MVINCRIAIRVKVRIRVRIKARVNNNNNNNDNEIESTIKVQSESEPGSFQQYTSGQSIKGKTGEKFADINWKKPKKRLTTKLANINYENELEPQTFQETIYHSIYGKK